jgi:hypothetical protein
MAKHQLELFCTANDFVALVDEVQKQMAIFFALAGLFEDASVRMFKTSADLSAAMASTEGALAFLAFAEGSAVGVREVPQRKGLPRYAVDQISNPNCLVVRPGRRVDPRTLLAGQIGTASNDKDSMSLFRMFANAVRQQFVKVKSYWVGTEALRTLDSGGRLTASLAGSSEYDLRR